MPGNKDGALNVADNILAPFKPTWQEWFREFESISGVGYERKFRSPPRHVCLSPATSTGRCNTGVKSFCRRFKS